MPQAHVSVSVFHSLRWRLPLLISGLVAVVLAAFLWTAYSRVEATLVNSAGERAQNAADLVASLLDGERMHQQLNLISADPAIRQFLETRTDELREAARTRLLVLGGGGGVRRIDVWDESGARVLAMPVSGRGAAADPDDEARLKALPIATEPPKAAGIGELQAAGDTVFLDTVAELRRSGVAEGHLGYVRVRSTFVENPPGIFNRLLGADARVRVGNRSGAVWTDFTHVVPSAPINLGQAGVAEYVSRSGQRRLGAVALVRETPFAAWVEFSKDSIVAPARGGFLAGMISAAAVLVIIAGLLAFAIAGRITAPLIEINTAAAAVAAGDYSRKVTTDRRDEIGQLGRAFSAMAADVSSWADALRKSEDSYRRLFASNPHPMWVYEMASLRFIDVNDMAVEHYGYSREEFLAMTLKDIRPEADIPALIENIEQAGSAVNRSGVWTHRKKNGELIEVEVSSNQLMLDGRPARVALAHDVTEERRTRRALEESEQRYRAMNATLEVRVRARTAELEAANQELESFSYSVSHDLRAPLRHVQGYVEMVTAATEGQLSDKVKRYLKIITEATVEMGDLIDDLLAFSRIGRAQMTDSIVPLDTLVQDTIARLEMATRDRNIVWKIAPLPVTTGDAAMLKQVYINLVGNAIKYSRQRDPAEIEIGCSGHENGHAILFVRDNGAGFDMRYVHKLFGVFQRLHRSDEFEGTGIGLATVRRIVTRHGGRTWAEGKIDEGATIYFTLPAAAAQAGTEDPS